jgi:TonB family protein
MALLFKTKRFQALSLMLCIGCVAPRMHRNSPTSGAHQGLQQGDSTSQHQHRDSAAAGGSSSTENANGNQKNSSNILQNPMQIPLQNIDNQTQRASTSSASNSGTGGTVSDSLSETVVEGGLSKKTVGRVLQSKREKILTCYSKELRNNPEAQGLVLTKIDINQTGKVDAVSVLQSDLGDMTFENCIVSEIRRWKFPAPRGGRVVRVSHPFRFSP